MSLGLAAIVGCAVGTDPGGVSEAELLNLPREAGDENSIVLPPPSKPSGDSGAGPGTPDAAALPDADVAPDAGPGPTVSCASPNTCPAATDLGSVSGDTGADVKTFQGSGSQWLKIRVTENDHQPFGVEMHMKAELQSPTGTNFDLFVYRAGSGTGEECAAVTVSSASAGGFDTASTNWGESGLLSNAGSDDRTITIEVRHVSGTCAPAAPWTLTVRGDML